MQKNISQSLGSPGLVSTGVSTSTGTCDDYYLLNIIRSDVFLMKYAHMLWTWRMIAKGSLSSIQAQQHALLRMTCPENISYLRRRIFLQKRTQKFSFCQRTVGSSSPAARLLEKEVNVCGIHRVGFEYLKSIEKFIYLYKCACICKLGS